MQTPDVLVTGIVFGEQPRWRKRRLASVTSREATRSPLPLGAGNPPRYPRDLFDAQMSVMSFVRRLSR
jgi:hypothetical protein